MVPNPYVYSIGLVSWGSVLAGVVTALAIWLIMAIIGLALSFKVVEPKSSEATAGLGKTIGGWYVASVLASLAGGGFMAGSLAAHRGLAHGFLVWAVLTIVLMMVSGHAVSSVVRGLLSAIQGLGYGAAALAGSAASVGKEAAQAALESLSHLKENLNIDLDVEKIGDKINHNLTDVLRDTGSEKLQPEYLKNQFREMRRDLKKLIRQVSLEPTQAESQFNSFLETVRARVKDLTGDIDKETAVTTLMNNRNIPWDDAQKMLDNALKAYNQAVSQAKESLDDLEDQINETKDHLKKMADQARIKADQMTNAAAKGASAVAAYLVIAALLSMGFGLWGAHWAMKWHPHPPVPHYYVTTR